MRSWRHSWTTRYISPSWLPAELPCQPQPSGGAEALGAAGQQQQQQQPWARPVGRDFLEGRRAVAAPPRGWWEQSAGGLAGCSALLPELSALPAVLLGLLQQLRCRDRS